MEAYPKNTTNLTSVYKMACNRCICVDWSWLLGLGVGRSNLHGVVTAINYAIQCILGVGCSALHGVVTAVDYAIQCISVSRY